jgi:phosphoserine phosphatase RsbU/P
LPAIMPHVPDYDVAGRFVPADQTGGDTFDLVPLGPSQLFIMMGDASGHGIGSALSATQLTAMLRVALRLGASLEDLFRHVNDQLCEDLPEEQFVTAFLGILDVGSHTLRFHSGGQGPLLHYRAATDECVWLTPSTFPMGFVTYEALGAASSIELGPGDVVALLSDGIYECERHDGQQFGTERVAATVRSHAMRPMADLLVRLYEATCAFAAGAPQLDDMTIVLLRRLPGD